MWDIAEEVHLPLRSIHIDGLVRDAIGDIASRRVLVHTEELPVLRGAISCYCYHFQAHALHCPNYIPYDWI